MSEGQDGKAERIARYKEQRRRELAARFDDSPRQPLRRRTSKDSSGSEGPRPTRTSRLRAAATTAQEGGAVVQTAKSSPVEKPSGETENRRLERDKSSKRKSNLNRALNSEEVPGSDLGDVKSRRRRRRFFPQEVLDHAAAAKDSSSNDDRTKSDTTLNASLLSQSSASPVTASPRLTPRKSELSMHMENARKGVKPSYSEIGKVRAPAKKREGTSKNKPKSCNNLDGENPTIRRSSNTESRVSFTKNKSSSDNDARSGNKNFSKKMEELTALTKETLARVERLAGKNKEQFKQLKRPTSNSPVKQIESFRPSVRHPQPSSILKKETIVVESIQTAAPVSILKRKVSQDDPNKTESSSTHTPPVTFSPSVVEPTTTNRKQGILKKRRSLDESQVMRHRSCSPDVANKITDSRSILKNQRRSSLEELTRTRYPEVHLHGILKRKPSRTDEEADHSLNSPQGILKRRSGASSAGSAAAGTPHVSITTAVILAAAGGAEMILEPEAVRPILKKKSFSEDHACSESWHETAPRPILKKKSSTDTEEYDEQRPKKPILKMTRNSLERDVADDKRDAADCCRPILKQNGEGTGTATRPRLSFCGDDAKRSSRRSNTICAASEWKGQQEGDRQLRNSRPLSVSELVMNFETNVSTGAVPKKSSLKRNGDRYRTQPVTSNELEASLNLVRIPQLEGIQKLPKSTPIGSPVGRSANSYLEYTPSDNNLNTFLLSWNTSSDNGVCGKMSSDSAFQSLGDGLELDDDKPPEVAPRSCVELQMKAIAEEAQKIKLARGGGGFQKYRNRKTQLSEDVTRFSTQPVTLDEVQEASRINKHSDEDKGEADPANLSLFERIKLFNENASLSRDAPRRRLNRFQTQPVTSEEVESARCISPTSYALDCPNSGERRGILKSSGVYCRARGDSPSPHPRSVLKKRDSFDGDCGRKSILKTEAADVTYDEGISCNDSASDSETPQHTPEVKVKRQVLNKFGKSNSETSDGDSSGGREIRSIFRNENKLKVKQALESVLSKSKSHTNFGDEIEASVDRKSSSLRKSNTQTAMPRAIEEIQAKLQQSGESDWKKRVHLNSSSDELKHLNRYNDELSEKTTMLEIKKTELDAASKQWKSRVEKSDAEKFSVAGRMEHTTNGANLTVNIPSAEKNKRTPQAKRFKGKEGVTDSSSTPASPEKIKHVELVRSCSVPGAEQDSSGSDSSLRASGRKVSVIRPDDFTFTNFYKSVEGKVTCDSLEVSLDDFDHVTRHSLLVQRKNVQVQKRRGASKNPVKALASRADISNEYTEILTGVAEREKKRLNIEKLAKSSNLAPAALAGLVSKVDFTSVALKKKRALPTTMAPYKDVMLLQVKGRQHVQTRLVEPNADSINEGDNYILVTSDALYTYAGKFSNVIEQSRAADVVNHIQQTSDLGCKDAEIVGVVGKTNFFWETLDCEAGHAFAEAGHPDEDAMYEANILATNMIYKLEGGELVPYEEFWGALPKFSMLEANKIFVFDFGTEMYVWSGKNAGLEKKKLAVRLAKELWDLGYDYSECSVCPLNVATMLGGRSVVKDVVKKDTKRPDWALFAKLTQHRETILFKEKFLDWPDFSKVIRIKARKEKFVDASYNIQACDVDETTDITPDLIVQNHHLGRGVSYFDEGTSRLFEFETLKVSVWRILDNHPEQLAKASVGHFYNGDSYVVKWHYRTTVKGRELSGKPSKHKQAGRDKCIYFCWQGANASINEKGSAALLTVELDIEQAPQVRVLDGTEPAAFLRLFGGAMVVHSETTTKARLFMVRGELEEEVRLVEVACEAAQLRSRTSFVLVESRKVVVWHGCRTTRQTRKVAKMAARNVVKRKDAEFGYDDDDDDDDDVKDSEVFTEREGEESDAFLDVVGVCPDSYFSLLNRELECDRTTRLFYLSSISGSFKATEILCPHRSEYSSPYPFLQSELYSASQPALFLIDNHHELWLWQGWWPEREEEVEPSDQTGSGAVRWQAERKAAMRTACNYWRKDHPDDESVPAYLVWAGLEPLEFKNLFPYWMDRSEIAELNLKEGKKFDAKLSVEKELALLSRSTYPLVELLQRPLPDGVDPTHLEIYLSPEDFEEALAMSKEEFLKLPPWKQTAVKKEKGLF